MIYQPLSKFTVSGDKKVAPGATITAEGMALVRSQAAPYLGVQPSTSANTTDIFVGVSTMFLSAAPVIETYATKVETVVVPLNQQIVLGRAPVAGQYNVYDVTASAAVTGLTLTGNVLSGAGLIANDTVEVTYRYEMSATEVKAKYGDQQPGGYVGAIVGQVGVVSTGTIYTDQFDASKNWRAATAVKLGDNGQFTDQSGTGAELTNVVIVGIPSEDYPFLQLQMNAV